MRCDASAGMLSWLSCQSPVAQSHGLLNCRNSFCREMFKLNAKFDAGSLLYSVILNGTATQYTCSLSGVYRPHWLVQWICHYSRMCIPVHSPRLPGYVDGRQTVFFTLTMAELFPGRLCVYVYKTYLYLKPQFQTLTNWQCKHVHTYSFSLSPFHELKSTTSFLFRLISVTSVTLLMSYLFKVQI